VVSRRAEIVAPIGGAVGTRVRHADGVLQLAVLLGPKQRISSLPA
jgi:hypothetical protein